MSFFQTDVAGDIFHPSDLPRNLLEERQRSGGGMGSPKICPERVGLMDEPIVPIGPPGPAPFAVAVSRAPDF